MLKITKELYHQIATICEAGSNVAIVGDNIFIYHSFTPSSSGNTSSIDFCSITGVNVTEFFTMNPIDINVIPVQYLAKFLKYLEPLPILNIKFNKTFEYFLFSGK